MYQIFDNDDSVKFRGPRLYLYISCPTELLYQASGVNGRAIVIENPNQHYLHLLQVE